MTTEVTLLSYGAPGKEKQREDAYFHHSVKRSLRSASPRWAPWGLRPPARCCIPREEVLVQKDMSIWMGVTCRVGVQNSEAVDFLPYTHWATWRTSVCSAGNNRKRQFQGPKGDVREGPRSGGVSVKLWGRKINPGSSKTDSQQPGRGLGQGRGREACVPESSHRKGASKWLVCVQWMPYGVRNVSASSQKCSRNPPEKFLMSKGINAAIKSESVCYLPKHQAAGAKGDLRNCFQLRETRERAKGAILTWVLLLLKRFWDSWRHLERNLKICW